MQARRRTILTGGALLAATMAAGLPRFPQARADFAGGDGPPKTTWGGTAQLTPLPEHYTTSDGDLWPTAWSADGNLYSAWGDGHGFGKGFVDIGVARITGDDPGSLSGENLAVADEVIPHPWTPNTTRKPTGMLAVGTTLYLAVQDLSFDFNEAPAATIAKSTDSGRTWTTDTAKPMFADGVFTTIWFADFGKGGEWSHDRYAYAYALDHNWRGQDAVYLARVPKDKVDVRGTWEFFTGVGKKGKPSWSKKIEEKKPVLEDPRRNYNNTFIDTTPGQEGGIISQGGTLYNAPLDRYILSAWTWGSHQFYEAPAPWGPFHELSYHDFTRSAKEDVQHWGYGVSLMSKFLSADGKTMQMQSNLCCGIPDPNPAYNFNLRTYHIEPLRDETRTVPSDDDLARDPDAVPIVKSVFTADPSPLTDGTGETSLTDWDNEVKQLSWWGVEWPFTQRVNSFTFTTGDVAKDGGWFDDVPWVEVRRDGEWKPVEGQSIDPTFTPGAEAGKRATYTVAFPAVDATGVRITGHPGGSHRYSSMSQVQVHHLAGRLIDGGFEATDSFTGAWRFDGQAARGIDNGDEHANTGKRNAWIRTSEKLGQQVIHQTVSVVPGSSYLVTAALRASEGVSTLAVGARWEGGKSIKSFTAPGTFTYDVYKHTVTIPDGVTSIDVVAGYSADGGDRFVQIDDVEITTAR